LEELQIAMRLLKPVFTLQIGDHFFQNLNSERIGLRFDAYKTEPVFADLLRRPGIDFQPGVPVRQPYFSYRPVRPHRLAKSIPGLQKRLQIRPVKKDMGGYMIDLWREIVNRVWISGHGKMEFLSEFESRARIFKLLRNPRIDSEEPIQPGGTV
jgi:hypothetical protein